MSPFLIHTGCRGGLNGELWLEKKLEWGSKIILYFNTTVRFQRIIWFYLWSFAFWLEKKNNNKKKKDGDLTEFVASHYYYYYYYYFAMLGLHPCMGFSLVADGEGYSLLQCMGLSLQWLLCLRSTSSSRWAAVVADPRLWSTASAVAMRGLHCSKM